ncbi:MAG TPA: hypothetical protein EYG86_09665 [Crocinitomicaceae bacterium]|nr:hypothetical protein [Crocinitomicaceae bacterium]
MQASIKPTLVEKEIISSLPFKADLKVEQHPKLSEQIKKATKLGNSYRRKVSILFKDDHGLKRVDTTIWANGEKYICLKGGVWIPIERIVEVRA